MTRSKKLRLKPVAGAVSAALFMGAPQIVLAQDADEAGVLEEVVVTGIRDSMRDNMNIKRSSVGILDAVTAEDIGKFPDTNLAESLQRIPGVSIDRRNGEGSRVTVRGFGPGFNLVTLNGRTLPTATIGIIGQRDNYTGGQGRSFGFENIASEGVNALEVYKTGQALLPSGGIGATINIQTRRPLDTSVDVGSVALKAHYDESVKLEGDSVTPEVSGLYNWSNDDNTFGVGIFGSYAQRDSGSAVGQANDWVVRRADDFFSNTSIVRAGSDPSNYTNPPADGELYAIPQDSRYDYSDISRERVNGQLVVQWEPMDNLRMTADYTYVKNNQEELRAEQTNWFATPFDQLIFDGDTSSVSQALFMQENNNGQKDIGFEQTNRATEESIKSLGFNLEWDTADNQRLTFDVHSSEGSAKPDNPLGHTATFVTFGGPVVLQHSVDWTRGFPVQDWDFTDDHAKGNGNGVFDTGDLATQVQRSSTQRQDVDIKEMDLRYLFDWDFGVLTFGANYRDTEVYVEATTTQQDLGSWGMSNPGDVDMFAAGLVEQYCMACQFNDFPVGDAETAFRADAAVLFPIFQSAYSGNNISTNSSQNTVQEEIMAYFANFTWDTELFGRAFQVNAGLRYEETDVKSFAFQAVPTNILWIADNDFVIEYSPNNENVEGSGKYDHWLPNLDLKMDLTEDLVARFSYSETIGRVPYGNLFASTTAGGPNRPTALGGQTGGSSQNPALLPLESENIDISFEWYFGESSYVSVGYFDKTVKNFLGTGVFNRPLFGLLDPTAGTPGSRSGDSLDVIDDLGVDRSEANLFTLVALIDANGGDVGAARAEFESNLVNGALPQDYVDEILGLYDVSGDSADPEMIFRVTQPINDEEGNIDGWEFAAQHFFGDSGFGLAGSYTMVDGDVEADPGQDPDENQFALVGLSDTANLTFIYENYGWSARLAYNWRDTFLNATNQGGSRSPQYTDEFSQWDLNVTWNINDRWQLQFEGINLTGEDSVQYRRKEKMIVWAYELDPRYALGVRYRF
jgi:TonB-dependent receptor